MNKEEAKQKLHNLAFVKLDTRSNDLNLADVMQIVDQIDELVKVTIPKFVAEWIEKTKRVYNLYGAMGRIKDKLAPSEIMEWFSTNPTLTGEILAHAWLEGYEVEKEKLYYVNIPNVYHGDFGYSETHDNYSFYNKSDATEIRFELTESEIKLEHEWAWQWARPVEEFKNE